MKVQRLLKLASFLGKIHPSKFNYYTWVGGQENPIEMAKNPRIKERCGTTACAIGWCPAIWPEAWSWASNAMPVLTKNIRKLYFCPVDQAANWFNISKEDTLFLFTEQRDNVTAREMATLIRKFVRDHA